MKEILNPYIAGAPVVEASMFFGREDVFDWIERNLAGKYVDHILVLHGQRRVGKTSVLKQIPNFLPEKYIQVFFDLQGRTNTTLDRFLWWLAREIARTLKQELNITTPPPNRVDFSTNPEYLIQEFLPGISSLLDDHILLLTFDEFDTLTDPSIQDSLSKPLIAYLRRLMENKRLNFIFSIGSSGNKLEHMQAAYTDFFKTALYRKISFLKKDDCTRLITQPVAGALSYDPQALEQIFEVTSGHPYFVQLVCHELFSMCQKTGKRNIDGEDVENILSDVVERGTVNLKFVWDEATILQKWVLAGLAQFNTETATEQLSQLLREQQVRFTEADLNSALIYLRDKDVITEKNQFVIHLMRMWMQINRPFDRVREELTEANPIISRNLELGQEYQASSRFAKAIECFNTALGEDPDNLDAQLGLGECYLGAGNLDQSVTVFSDLMENFGESIRVQTGYCNAYFALGDAEAALEHWEAARAAFLRVLEVNPLHRNATQELMRLYRIEIVQALLVGDIPQAQELLAEALKVSPDPDEFDIYSKAIQKMTVSEDVRFEILEYLSEQEFAREHWDEGYLIDSYLAQQHPETPMDSDRLQSSRQKAQATRVGKLNHWARTFTDAGEYVKALAFWRRLLEFDLPESERIRQTIRQIETDFTAQSSDQAYRNVWRRVWIPAVLVFASFVIFGIFFGPRLLNAIFTADTSPTITVTDSPVTAVVSKPTVTDIEMPVSTEPSSVPEKQEAEEDIKVNPAVQVALNKIQIKEPTYKHSFDYWDLGAPVENVAVENGMLIIANEMLGQQSYINLSNLNSERFAVEVDLEISGSETDEANCYIESANNHTGESTRMLLAGFSHDGNARLGHYVHPDDWPAFTGNKFEIADSNKLTFIVIGEQITTLVDGQIIYSALDPDGSALYYNHGLGAEGEIICSFDEYRIWDLSEVDFTDAGIPPPLDPATRNALEIIKNEQPLFETNFDTWVFGVPWGDARVENGKLIVTSESRDKDANATPSRLKSDSFAVEFEIRMLESPTSLGHCNFNFINDGTGELRRYVPVGFFADGTTSLGHYVHPDQWIEVVVTHNKYDFTQFNSATVIVFDEQITVFLNGELAYTVPNPDRGTLFTQHILQANWGASCEFDNYKLWDLQGVELDQ